MSRIGGSVLAALVTFSATARPAPAQGAAPASIVTHDNARPAGRLDGGTLTLSLWAGLGRWLPEGPKGPPREVAAFGEEGGLLSIPSPLVRVPVGTRVRVTIRNTLDFPLHLNGFCDRAARCDPLVVAPGATGEATFVLGAPGTFGYWADFAGGVLEDRTGTDSQLGGAIVVDSLGAVGTDRVFVLGMMGQFAREGSLLAVINGRSWPATERLEYRVGEPVRWRMVNLSTVAHPMHLHGFYFDVERSGDGIRDEAHPPRTVVTERVQPGGTRAIRWVPERPGSWLLHCHMVHHHVIEPRHGGAGGHGADSAAHGMQGLVLGIRVTGPAPAEPAETRAPRRLELVVSPDTRHGSAPSYRVDLVGGDGPAPRVSDRPVPGPVMVLTRGEPVAIDVVNRLSEPTAIHWHGIELESRYDGVPGLSGTPGSVTPEVRPGERFTARFTPPRAGTFMYHTHWHNRDQLAAGVYGPLIVLEPGERYDPIRDRLIVIGLDGPYRETPEEPFAINGERKPAPFELAAGMSHRLRILGIPADNPNLTLQLLRRFDPVQWTVVAKDGAAIPAAQRRLQPARIGVAVGETYDVELGPLAPGALWFELRRGDGELVFQWPVRVR